MNVEGSITKQAPLTLLSTIFGLIKKKKKKHPETLFQRLNLDLCGMIIAFLIFGGFEACSLKQFRDQSVAGKARPRKNVSPG
jgi:hypothetical protein